jgi:hypothetical protein
VGANRLYASGSSGICGGAGGGPGSAPLDIGGSTPLLLELDSISICSQLFGINGRKQVPDVF